MINNSAKEFLGLYCASRPMCKNEWQGFYGIMGICQIRLIGKLDLHTIFSIHFHPRPLSDHCAFDSKGPRVRNVIKMSNHSSFLRSFVH